MNRWLSKRLGDVITLEYGKPLPPDRRAPDGEVPVYGANGIKDWTNSAFRSAATIIVGRKGSAGEIQLTDGPYWPLDVTYYVDFDRGQHDLRFLYYLLKWVDLRKLAKGIKPGLNRNDAYNIPVLIAPMREQRRIVAVLDEAFASMAAATTNAEKNLANAQRMLDAWLKETIDVEGEGDWRARRLGDLTTKIGSGATPLGGKESYVAQGTPLIRSLNVHDRRFKREQLAYINDSQAIALNNVTLQAGDVLLNITGASVARCCILPENLAGGRVNQHVSIIRADQSVLLPRFLELLLTSPAYKERMLGVGEQGGSTRQAITKADIQNFEIVLPPVSIQRDIVQRAGQVGCEVDLLSELYSRKADLLAALKQSLLQQAFSGEPLGSQLLAA